MEDIQTGSSVDLNESVLDISSGSDTDKLKSFSDKSETNIHEGNDNLRSHGTGKHIDAYQYEDDNEKEYDHDSDGFDAGPNSSKASVFSLLTVSPSLTNEGKQSSTYHYNVGVKELLDEGQHGALVTGDEEEMDDDDSSSFVDANASILEPTCELAESDDYVRAAYKGRFNLRKRSCTQTSNETFCFDEEVCPDMEEPAPKKLKFNISKKNYRRQRPYTNEQVKEAVKTVLSKKISILEASRQFDIPRTSLHNFVRLYKRGRRMGVRTISPGLTKQEEEEMVSLVIKLSRCGKRYSHNELRFLIQYYLINNDRPVFKSGTLPTMGWIAGLVERQPELVKAKSKKNTKVAVEDVEEWQRQIEDYLVNDWDLDIEDIFRPENGHRIFCFNAFKITVNGPAENSENKPVLKKESSVTDDDKDHEVSVILGMSADGGFVTPLLVLNEENQQQCLPPVSNPKGLKLFFNKSGRVDEEVALRVVKEFDEEILLRGIPKPVVFFVNDKQELAHFSVIEYCWENQIVIICLPPKTCKTMTPFEVSIWPKIRSSYAMLWKNSPKFNGEKININQFSELFLKAWESASIPKQAIRGFTKSGLIPLDVPAILGDSALVHEPSEELPHTQIAKTEAEECIPNEFLVLEEKSRGKLEGIQMCLEAIEAFIPPDVFPIWSERGADYRGRCELGFKLWRSVSLLLKAGCAMASIQQMADRFFNPFASDFSSTSSFFQKTPLTSHPILLDPRPESSSEPLNLRTSSLPSVNDKPTPKKRKLNKSIYSTSAASLMKSCTSAVEEPKKCDIPLVKFHQNPFTMEMGEIFEEKRNSY